MSDELKQESLSLITHDSSLITAFLPFFARLDADVVEHVLTAEGFGDAFGFVFGERVFGINAGYLEEAVVEHDDAEHAEGDAGRDLYVAHVVYAKVAGLLNPIFDEGVAQGMLGFGF